jgi:hypothetical protein
MMKALPVERVLTYKYHGVTFLHYMNHHIHMCMYNNVMFKRTNLTIHYFW